MKALVVNSFDFGLAQNRGRRVFIIGVRQSAFGKKRPLPRLKPIRATKGGMSQCLDRALAGKVQSSDDIWYYSPILSYFLIFFSNI